jgi:8-oxo-dGTP pyrophosphatase MutT (NUDIX family)
VAELAVAETLNNHFLFSRLQQRLLPLDNLEARRYKREAAVLILLSDQPSPSILYTRRAQHLRRHPGEVCFPGGMWELQDANLLSTALRETQEEIGLPATELQLLGRLPEAYTKVGLPVTPFVAIYSPSFPLVAQPQELDAIFTVPLADFQRGIQLREDCFERQGKPFRVPVYAYQNFEIWGFTAAVTAHLLQLIELET